MSVPQVGVDDVASHESLFMHERKKVALEGV